MSRTKQVVIVVGGFVLALAATILATGLYDRRFSPADNQSMGGMIAGGEFIFSVGVFLFLGSLPTALALWFLRGSHRFWSAFSTAALAFAIGGAAAVVMAIATRGAGAPALGLAFLFGLAHMLGAPVWVGAFLLFALIAPARDLRSRLLLAAGIEFALGVCGLVYFLAPFSHY